MNLMLLPVLCQALLAGHGSRKKRQKDPMLFPFVLFLVFVFISWARVHFSDDAPADWLLSGGLYFNIVTLKEFISALIFYYCAKRLTVDEDDRLRTLLGIIAGFSFEALTATREFLFSGSWRATAHLAQPNKLGHFLSAYSMLAFGFLIDKDSRYRLYALALFGAGCFGLLGSVSRGSILAIVFAVTGTLVLRRSFWIVPLFIALLLSPLWLPDKVMNRFDEAVVESEMGEVGISQSGRIELWKTGMVMIAANPMGVGLEQFRYNLRPYGYTGRRLKSAHNIYISLAAEQGILACLLHVFMFGYIGLTSYRIYKYGRNSTERCIGTGVLGVVLAFSVSAGFGDGFYENNLSGLFWILAGLIMTLWYQIKNEPGGLRRA